MVRAAALALLLVLVAAAPAAGAPSLVQIGSFPSSTWAGGPPLDPTRVFVTEKSGRVRLIRDDVVLPAAFLDLSTITATVGERGLLSLAFAPDYVHLWALLRLHDGHRRSRLHRRGRAADPRIPALDLGS